MRRISAILLVVVLAIGAIAMMVPGLASAHGPIAAGGYYVVVGNPPQVWQESNGVDGLQTTATDQNGDGIAETPPDTQVA